MFGFLLFGQINPNDIATDVVPFKTVMIFKMTFLLINEGSMHQLLLKLLLICLVVVRRCLEACLLMETDRLTEIRLRAFRQGEQYSGELNS